MKFFHRHLLAVVSAALIAFSSFAQTNAPSLNQSISTISEAALKHQMAHPQYRIYQSPLRGFILRVPQFLTKENFDDFGDGAEFSTPDGRFRLTVQSWYSDESLRTLYEAADAESADYHAHAKDWSWFVYSSVNKETGNAFYNRVAAYTFEGERVVASAFFIFPKEYLGKSMDKLTRDIFNRFPLK